MRAAPAARLPLALLLLLLLLQAAAPAPTRVEPRALPAALGSLTSRVTARAGGTERLPLPTPQDIDTIRKVAQILVTLGEQVIPAIIGEPPAAQAQCCAPPALDAAPDAVDAD